MNQAKKSILSLLAFLALTAVSSVEQSSSEFVDQVISSKGRLDLSAVDQHYDELVLSETLTESIHYLDQLSQQGELNDSSKAKIHLTVAHWQWHSGQRNSALASVNSSLELADTIDAQFLKARILDASGKSDEAVQWYRKVADSTAIETERELTRVRLAMIDIDENNVETLIQLANTGDQEQKNRVAIVLAVLGHVERALELYQPDTESPRYVNQLLKRTEWSIAVEDFETAQESAWMAYDRSVARIDRLYALALTEESYQKAEDVPKLLAELNSREPLNEELRTLQIDQFIHLQEYDDAINLYKSLTNSDSSIAARQRLLKLYGNAQRYADLEAEYRRLIEVEPKVVEWYSGLASHYLVMDQPEKVQELWATFAEQNQDDAPTLVQGADSMLRFGLESKAINYVEKHLDGGGKSIYAFMFLFETHLNRGRESEAKAVIERLAGSLTDDSKDLRVVADAYERLNDFASSRDIYLRLEKALGKLSYDERNRLAWLHSVSGNKQNALELYKEIWIAATSPARRSFAESQLLLLAAELNVLGDLAIELEQKLFKNEVNKNELNLLVRIYSEVGDAFSATEVIEEFARGQNLSRVDLLKQLASTYLQMLEYSKYDEILRELVEIDSEDQVEHIQNIILNIVTLQEGASEADRLTEIQKWVERLRAFDPEAVNSEFLANVLSMSGYTDEAIQSYQNALIEQPTHSDNLLLMADLLQSDNRTVEAVNMLQYIAEHANDDNEFIVAIDGIINMIGQVAFGAALSREDKATFRWTFRIILERIATRADKIYLYALLGEIAQEIDDKAGEYSALENAISLAGLRRPALLRELFTMATPGAGYSFLDRNVGDPARQLLYGRRLIGLRQQLPPSVFIELGKTLLDQGEFLGAERAFEQINDITGMIDVPQTKADLYYEAGYSDQSMEYYARAQVLDQNNVELQIKTAFLRELLGQIDVAHTSYMATLATVLNSQPISIPESAVPGENPNIPVFIAQTRNQSVTHDYKTFYEFLVQGLFTTYDPNEETKIQLTHHARSLFDEALASTLGSESNLSSNLALYSRLNTTSKHARRIARFTDDYALSSYVNDQLKTHFADDDSLESALENQRNYWYSEEEGFTTDSTTAETIISAAIERWSQTGSDHNRYQQSIRLAHAERDTQSTLTYLNQYFSEGHLYESLSLANSVLEDDDLKRFLSTTLSELRNHPDKLLQLLIGGTELVQNIEEKIGFELVPATEFLELLNSPEAKQAIARNYFTVLSGLWEYVLGKQDNSLKLDYLSYASTTTDIEVYVLSREILQLYRLLIQQPLSEEENHELLEIMKKFNNRLDFADEFVHSTIIQTTLVLNIPSENQSTHFELAEIWIQKAKLDDEVANLLVAYKNDDQDLIVQYVLELISKENRGVNRYFELVQSMKQTMKGALDRKYDEVLQGNVENKQTALSFYELYFFDLRFGYRHVVTDADKKVQLLESLIRAFPDDDVIRRRLILLSISLQDLEGIESSLESYFRFDPADEYIRAAYYLFLVEHEKFDKASEILADDLKDLRDPNVVKSLEDTVRENANIDQFASGRIFLNILEGEYGSRGVVIASRSDANQSTERAIETAIKYIDENSTSKIPSSIISLWRKLQLDNTQDSYGYGSSTRNLTSLEMEKNRYGSYYNYDSIYSPHSSKQVISFDDLIDDEESKKPEKLLSVATQRAPLGLELEKVFLSLRRDEQNTSQYFRDFVLKAYEHDERRKQREDSLYQQLLNGSLNSHEFLLWTTLRLENSNEPSEEETQAFLNHVNSLNKTSLVQLPSIARLLALFGLPEESARVYMFTASAIVSHTAANLPIALYSEGNNTVTLLSLCDEISTFLPPDLAWRTNSQILDIAFISNLGEMYQNVHRAFVLDVILNTGIFTENNVHIREYLNQLQGSNLFEEPTESLIRIKLARFEALNARQDVALELLQPIFKSSKPDPNEESSKDSQSLSFAMRSQNNWLSLLRAVNNYGIRSFPLIEGGDYKAHYFAIAGRLELVEGLDEVWLSKLIDTCFDWLNDDSYEETDVAEFLLVLIHELYEADHSELADASLTRVANWVLSKEEPATLAAEKLHRNIALLGLENSVELPLSLVARTVRIGILEHDDEVRLLKNVSERSIGEIARVIPQFGDVNQKGFSFLSEFQRLANENEVDVTPSLQGRIDALEQARDTLNL